MYHFVSGFINVTDLSVDVAWQVPGHARQSTSSLHLILLLFIL